MRIHKIDIANIIFKKKSYTQNMYASIKRIGLSFPIKVRLEEGRYYCQDGHKRLTALKDMVELEGIEKRRIVNIIIVNNGDSRSNDCWRSRNMH